MAMGQVYNLTVDYNMNHEDMMQIATMAMDVDHSMAMSWFEILLEQIQDNTEIEKQIHEHKLTIYKKVCHT